MSESAETKIAVLEARYEALEKRVDTMLAEINTKLDSILEWRAEVRGGKKALFMVIAFLGAVVGYGLSLLSKIIQTH